MVIDGLGVYQIANILTAEKVLIPSAHWKKIGSENLRHQSYQDPCLWRGTVIRKILEKAEYMGHTVVFKTQRESYKNKKSKETPLDERVIFENTHEAIIDPETWHNAQRLRRPVRKPTKHGTPNRLTGLLYCADCGSKMSHDRSIDDRYGRSNKNEYVCSNYRVRTRSCTIHFIRVPVVEELILNALQEVSSFARNNEEAFTQLVMEASTIQQVETAQAYKKKLSEHKRRTNELDNIIRKLYEDKISGALSEKRFTKLSDEYEREQEDIEQTMENIQTELNDFSDKNVRADKFLELVKKYTDFTQLTTSMLNEFIEKVIVHERVKEYRYKTTQRVDIYFNFIGMVEIPKAEMLTIEESEIKQKKQYNTKNPYKLLEPYLEQQNCSLLTLSFSEIEQITEAKLCETAYKHGSYWYPSRGSKVAKIIFNAGYDIKKLDLKNQTITLTKPEELLVQKIGDGDKIEKTQAVS